MSFEPTPMDDLASSGTGRCWYCAEKLKLPRTSLARSSTSLGSARRMKKLSCPTMRGLG